MFYDQLKDYIYNLPEKMEEKIFDRKYQIKIWKFYDQFRLQMLFDIIT